MTNFIFVYNADSSLFAQLIDYAHKTISPDTYSCALCKLTYGNLGMKQDWKKFIQSLPIPVKFLHRDEFKKSFPDASTIQFPALLEENQGKIDTVLTSNEIAACQNIEALKKVVNKFLIKHRTF